MNFAAQFCFILFALFVSLNNELIHKNRHPNQLGEYYSIEGHPKAKGVNLKIKTPEGWEIKEGDRPNIVVKFVKGTDNYIIQVNEAGTFATKNQAREILSDPEYKKGLLKEYNSIFKEVRILNERIVVIDQYPALEFEVTGSMEGQGTTINFRMKIWHIYYEDRFIILQGGIFGGRNYGQMLNFFTSISNTVIFPDQYSMP